MLWAVMGHPARLWVMNNNCFPLHNSLFLKSSRDCDTMCYLWAGYGLTIGQLWSDYGPLMTGWWLAIGYGLATGWLWPGYGLAIGQLRVGYGLAMV